MKKRKKKPEESQLVPIILKAVQAVLPQSAPLSPHRKEKSEERSTRYYAEGPILLCMHIHRASSHQLCVHPYFCRFYPSVLSPCNSRKEGLG